MPWNDETLVRPTEDRCAGWDISAWFTWSSCASIMCKMRVLSTRSQSVSNDGNQVFFLYACVCLNGHSWTKDRIRDEAQDKPFDIFVTKLSQFDHVSFQDNTGGIVCHGDSLHRVERKSEHPSASILISSTSWHFSDLVRGCACELRISLKAPQNLKSESRADKTYLPAFVKILAVHKFDRHGKH